jgi:hypothetical protein
VALSHVTLAGNSATGNGGGISNTGDSTATVEMGQTIVDQTGVTGASIYSTATFTSDGYNLSSDAAGGDATTGPGGLLNQTGDIRNTDPNLAMLADNGGPTLTHALSCGSAAVDAGDPNFASPPDNDQRGTGFPRVVNGRIDIGAFELQTACTGTTTTTSSSTTSSTTSTTTTTTTTTSSSTTTTTLPKCPRTQGFWKNHPAAWPVTTLTLGSQTYTQEQLLAILGTPTGTGPKADASLILADQLIAAKLNIANGSDPTSVSSTIAHADSLLASFSGQLPYKVRTSSPTGKAMISDANVLAGYNNGALTPSCTA